MPSSVAFVTDVQGVTHALTLLNSDVAQPVAANINTLVIYSESQRGHFTVKRSPFGTWDPGTSYHGDVSAIATRVYLTTEGEAGAAAAAGGTSGGGGDDDGSSGPVLPAGRAMTPQEALAAYKQYYPKAKGMSDKAILEYIAAIVTTYNEKKSAGHLKVGKISTIQEACERAGLMGTNKMGQPAPFYQRGGRKNYRSRALEAIFHWVTGLSPKKKHGHGDADDGAGRAGGGASSSSSAAAAAAAAAGSRAGEQSSASSGTTKQTKRKDKNRVPGLAARAGAADPIAIAELSHYRFISKIGEGAFAVVYQAVHLPTGQRVAIKAMQKLSSNISRLQAEINVLKTIQHPNVTALSEVIETENHVYLVLEYMQGGELFDAIVAHGGYTEAQAAAVTRNILKALVYLHSKGVIHRDLKPENLLLVDSANLVDVKLTDFGMATILKDNCRLTFTKAGTLQYVAPEIICSDTGYSFAVDLWSLGIVVVCLLTGNAPFACRVPEEYRHAIESIASTNGSCLFGPQWRGISRNAQGFVHALLRVRPGDRPTAAQALLHPWLAEDAAAAGGGGGGGGGDGGLSDEDEQAGGGSGADAPRARLMKRPLSRNMERSHTNELRRYSNQRKRGRKRSAVFLKKQLAQRPESAEIEGALHLQGMDDMPVFDAAGMEELQGMGFGGASAGGGAGGAGGGVGGGGGDSPGVGGAGPFGLGMMEFPGDSPGALEADDADAGPVGMGVPGVGAAPAADRLSQASLFSVWSGIDDDLSSAMHDLLEGSP